MFTRGTRFKDERGSCRAGEHWVWCFRLTEQFSPTSGLKNTMPRHIFLSDKSPRINPPNCHSQASAIVSLTSLASMVPPLPQPSATDQRVAAMQRSWSKAGDRIRQTSNVRDRTPGGCQAGCYIYDSCPRGYRGHP